MKKLFALRLRLTPYALLLVTCYLLLLPYGCNPPETDQLDPESQKLTEENQRLKEENTKKDEDINAFIQSFNEIQDNLDLIKEREKLV